MYWGALFGGSTTSILFNIPGEPSSVATTFDGYPMARKGHAAQALTLAFLSAAFGALVGVIVITLLSGWAANFALKFGSPEYFAVYFLAFASFVGLGGASPLKTLVSMGLGLALATIGMDTISGSLRLTFGFDTLVSGVSFLVAVIGLFGIGELLLSMRRRAIASIRASQARRSTPASYRISSACSTAAPDCGSTVIRTTASTTTSAARASCAIRAAMPGTG